MRISDWSSDVCSSDLFDGTTSQFGPVLKLTGNPINLGQTLDTVASTKSYAAFGQGTLRIGDSLRLNVGLRLDREEVKAKTVGRLYPGAVAPEIGSASCRESGCQYV